MSHHTLLHRLVRPIVPILVVARVTPDQITTLRLLTGLGAALSLVRGPAGTALGAGLFLLSALLDRLDGTLARRTGISSRLGPRFDLVADCLSTMGFFVGLGIGEQVPWLPALLPPVTAAWLSPLLGIGAACAVVLMFWQLAQAAPEKDPVRLLDPDDVMVMLPILLWLGAGDLVLLAAGIVSPVAALVLWWVHRNGPAIAGGLAEADRQRVLVS